MARVLRTLLALAVIALSSARARAAPLGDVEAWVLSLDGGDVFVDLSAKDGAAVGDVVELWRPIKLKHPVSGKTVVDRFRIGSLKLTQVRDAIALAKPDGPLFRPVEKGDVVILRGAPAPKPPPVQVAPVPPTTPVTDPETRALTDLFEELHGTNVEVRVARYEAFAKAWPKGRFAAVLLEEAAALRKSFALPSAGPATAPEEHPSPASVAFEHPQQTLAGTALTISVEVEGDVRGAVLQLRLDGENAYRPLPMSPAGKRYYRVVLPREHVRAPSISYFIEVVLPDGKTRPIEGDASSPHTTKVVDPPVTRPPTRWLSSAAVWTDYADYNRLRNNDWAWQTEGWFGMRFRDVGLRAVRSGFGVFRGRGGSLEELDQLERSARNVGLSYGYIEAEWATTSFWGIVGRAIVGLSEDGITGGGQLFLRLGNDRKTNMLIGGELLGGVGLRGITQIELNTFRYFPILFRSEVTNQPAGTPVRYSDRAALGEGTAVEETAIGVRGIIQVGYRPVRSLTFFVRGSYQGRTINHAGPGVGAGALVEW